MSGLTEATVDGWYYLEGGQRRGPVSADTIADLIRIGSLTYGTSVWRPGQPDWIKLEDSDLRVHLMSAGPPPVPGASGVPARTAGVGFTQAVAICLRKYASFGGRAPRSEFWYFTLAYTIVFAVVSLLGTVSNDLQLLSGLLWLVLLLPILAVQVRRLHDLDRSGWWVLICFLPIVGPILLLVWFCTAGTAGANRFGAQPA